MTEPEYKEGKWYAIDGHQGITYVPVEDVGEGLTLERLEDYYDGSQPLSFEIVTGVGCRFSLPDENLADCTAWTVFDNKKQAKAYLDKMAHSDVDVLAD